MLQNNLTTRGKLLSENNFLNSDNIIKSNHGVYQDTNSQQYSDVEYKYKNGRKVKTRPSTQLRLRPRQEE